jgi:RNA polymerase sigma-70 factor, ECF subfamily
VGAVAQADDTRLVRQAQDDNLDAYGELAGRHGKVAYRVGLRLVGNHHDAEDIAQEALLAAWQHLDCYRAESSFPTWLYQIVTRRAQNQITRSPATSSLDLLGDIAGPRAASRDRGAESDGRRGGSRYRSTPATAASCDRLASP